MNPVSPFIPMKSNQCYQNQKTSSNLHFNAGSSRVLENKLQEEAVDILNSYGKQASKMFPTSTPDIKKMVGGNPDIRKATMERTRTKKSQIIREQMTEQRDRKLRPELHESNSYIPILTDIVEMLSVFRIHK